MILNILLFIVALGVLVKSSDWFVQSAEDLGLSKGISPFVIGVTIIAFGTSLPELAASIAAVLQGDSGIVLGNVVGSNITNILFVLGLTAVLSKNILLDYDVMRVDMPLLIGSSFLLWFIMLDGQIGLVDCVLLLTMLVIFLVNSLKGKEEQLVARPKANKMSYWLLPLSAILVFLGAHYTIVAIKQISAALHVPTEIIALSAVALGTSLPEVVVSITAARKGKSAIAVGNVLGSNIFNTLAVVGIPGFIGPISIPDQILTASMPYMLAITFIFAFVCISKNISRWEGGMLLILYMFYLFQTCL